MSYWKSWRDSASLIALSRKADVSRLRRGDVNYDILLQTRTRSASFPNSVVFPGGVSEPADAASSWLQHLASFGYSKCDFEALHRAGTPLTPIFKDNPVQRHISLRITAIRETFEELGLLLCRRDHKKERGGPWAGFLTDFDVTLWQKRVSKNPEQLLTLCKELNCYPDIWSLHYWSNWLSPARITKRFSTAFFVAALESKPSLTSSSEVTRVEWASPKEVLERPDVILYPPQVYELYRLSHIPDIEQLVGFAKERSCHGQDLFYPVFLKAKDGILDLLPGDDLYPTSVDYNDNTVKPVVDKTLAELREGCRSLHRFEKPDNGGPSFRIQNYTPAYHINMGDCTIPAKVISH